MHEPLLFRRRCLADIKASFYFGYPEELTCKLYERRGRCYVNLGQHDLAANAFEEAINKVKESRLDAKKKEAFIEDAKKKLSQALKDAKKGT